MEQNQNEILLQVTGLKQYFKVSGKNWLKAVDGVTFSIRKGETYGLVGESGSGKTTIGRSLIRIYDPTEGTVWFNGREISGKLNGAERKQLTREMQMIFQDPQASLNPHKKVIDIIGQGLDNHHLYKNKEERKEKILAIMKRVGLDAEQAYRYPHQFSGGQRQRIGIARAFVIHPQLVIADEAISALDVSVQAQVVNLMKDLQEELGTTYLFIAHDLAMVKYISDHIGVLHLGHLVETGTRDEIFDHPIHPYTKSLLSAIPVTDPDIERNRVAIPYDYVTSGIDYSKGTYHLSSGEHYVLATDEEFHRWEA
ncbi:MAG: ATP-binding cassette domain-containing protein [Lachnospiraceae bacterium]|nr:ATP-binding cassette domain-containing protein [Lachnospiraceae bacterium]